MVASNLSTSKLIVSNFVGRDCILQLSSYFELDLWPNISAIFIDIYIYIYIYQSKEMKALKVIIENAHTVLLSEYLIKQEKVSA